MKGKKVLITAALPYANGAIHFGHLAGTYLPADCYARFQRLLGRDVAFICGSDEYGVAISMSAELAGRSPEEHVDHFHAVNKELFRSVGITFDHFSRTTWPGHVQTATEFFNSLLKNGYVEPKESERLFCEVDGKFYADRYVVGECPHCGFQEARGDECVRCGASYEAEDLKFPRTKIGKKSLVLKKTKHWYLRLDLFREKLLGWLEHKEWKPNVINFAKNFIRDLRPRAITRDMKWGIPVPIEGLIDKVLYVWFDAPIGYISATKEWSINSGDPEKWRSYWMDPQTELVQFLGKDNIPFHAVIFPAMIMGQDVPYKLVDKLPANEFYTLAGRQFSKSEGWFIDLAEFLQSYSADQLRYTIASNAPETQDSEFTWRDFQSRCNADLVGKFGNFVHRTLVFVKNCFGGVIPELSELKEEDKKFSLACKEYAQQANEAYEQFRLRRASQIVLELAQMGNVYFDTKKPWIEIRTDRKSAATTIACCLECVKTLALLASPIMPSAADRITEQLGLSQTIAQAGWDKWLSTALVPGSQLGEPKPLFRKVEDDEIAREEVRLACRGQGL